MHIDTQRPFITALTALALLSPFGCAKEKRSYDDGTAGQDSGGNAGASSTKKAGGAGGKSSTGSGGTNATAGSSNSGGTTATESGGTSSGGMGAGSTIAVGGTTSTTATTPPTLTVNVTSLPGAAYNAPYYAQLAGTGGTGPSFYNWSISNGTLPIGLTLAKNGELSGTPLQDGTFGFTVRVQDNEGNWGEKSLSILVARKRWLAYRSDQVATGRYVDYLLDYTKSELPVTDLSTYASPGCSEDLGEFSPDGKKFAFLATRGSNCDQKWLYVVDVSTATVGNALRVDKNAGVYSIYGWSPDSKWLAYSEMTNTASRTGDKYLVDVSGSAPASPVLVETAGILDRSHRFMSPTSFVWLNLDYYVVSAQLDTGPNGTWQAKPATTCRCGGGGIRDTRPSGIVHCEVPAKTSAMVVCDLAAGTTAPYMWGYYSYDYSLIVDFYYAGDILPPGLLKMVATNKVLSSSLNFGERTKAIWANTRTEVYVLATSTLDAFHVDVSPGGNGMGYATVANTAGFVNMKIAPNDKWVAWGSTTAVALSGSWGSDRTVVSETMPTGGTMSSDLQFAPNSKVFSFAGQMETAGVNELYVVDLSTNTAGKARKVNGVLASGTSVGTTGFTSDSSMVYYQVGKPPNATLYLSSAIAKDPQGISLATKYSAFRFQP